MKNKEKINYTVELYLGDVALTICTDKKFKGGDKNFGFITVGGLINDDKNCFWDNLDWFDGIKYKKFKEECEEELEDKGFNVIETFYSIKRLIKRAKKQKLIR